DPVALALHCVSFVRAKGKGRAILWLLVVAGLPAILEPSADEPVQDGGHTEGNHRECGGHDYSLSLPSRMRQSTIVALLRHRARAARTGTSANFRATSRFFTGWLLVLGAGLGGPAEGLGLPVLSDPEEGFRVLLRRLLPEVDVEAGGRQPVKALLVEAGL